jgi:hypothetical protein
MAGGEDDNVESKIRLNSRDAIINFNRIRRLSQRSISGIGPDLGYYFHDLQNVHHPNLPPVQR